MSARETRSDTFAKHNSRPPPTHHFASQRQVQRHKRQWDNGMILSTSQVRHQSLVRKNARLSFSTLGQHLPMPPPNNKECPLGQRSPPSSPSPDDSHPTLPSLHTSAIPFPSFDAAVPEAATACLPHTPAAAPPPGTRKLPVFHSHAIPTGASTSRHQLSTRWLRGVPPGGGGSKW